VDGQLVVRAQGGDRDAYERLARASADRLYAVAYQITRDGDRADDAVQQALVTIWRELPSLRDPARFEAWTYRLVVRACLTELRSRTRTAHVSLDDDIAPPASRDLASDSATRDQLQRALATLSPEHRAVVVLRHLSGLQIDEIAEVLGVPYGTVASRLHHAIRNLRAAVDAADRSPAMGGQPA
jgi:RNA polymerase sigma-70 factor (ECF subfamily)